MNALLHTAPGMLRAVCAGFKPDGWLQLMWLALWGSLLGHGPVAGKYSARPAGSAACLRAELGRVAQAVLRDVMKARCKAATLDLRAGLADDTDDRDAGGVPLDKLLASFERKSRSTGLALPVAGGFHCEIAADRLLARAPSEIAAGLAAGLRHWGRAPPARS